MSDKPKIKDKIVDQMNSWWDIIDTGTFYVVAQSMSGAVVAYKIDKLVRPKPGGPWKYNP